MDTAVATESFIKALKLPLAKFTVKSLQLQEYLSKPYEFEVYGYCAEPMQATWIGQPASFTLVQEQAAKYFHGCLYSVEVDHYDAMRKQYYYRLNIRPALSFWDQEKKYRIFQNKTVTQIIKEVVKDAAAGDTAKHIPLWHSADLQIDYTETSYHAVEFCVQYNETDYAFLHRLLARFGIGYYFAYKNNRHQWHLFDSSITFPAEEQSLAIAGPGKYKPHQHAAKLRLQIVPKSSVAKDYQSSLSETPLRTMQTKLVPDKMGQREKMNLSSVDYPAEAMDLGDTTHVSQIQLEALQAHAVDISAAVDEVTLVLGKQYGFVCQQQFTVGVFVPVHLSTYFRKASDEAPNHFELGTYIEAMGSDVPFRPPEYVEQPKITGVQTATVVAPDGKDADVSALGQIKVKFAWDKSDTKGANSSVYFDVTQMAVGDYGSQFIPRVGQEVVVVFEDGNPDRPIIVGSVNNPKNAPPYAPSTEISKTVWRSHSQNANKATEAHELCFEDQHGQESITLHSQKDLNTSMPGRLYANVDKTEECRVNNSHTTAVCHGDLNLIASQKLTLQVGGTKLTLSDSEITCRAKKILLQTTGAKPGKGLARKKDMHACPMMTGETPHVGGEILAGASSITVNNKAVARQHDAMRCVMAVDHVADGISGLLMNGQKAAYDKAGTVHHGKIVQASSDVISASMTATKDVLAAVQRIFQPEDLPVVRDYSGDGDATDQAAPSAETKSQSGSSESNLSYVKSPKHSFEARGRASPAPMNGQQALDNSIQIKESSERRIGIDYENNDIVVFDKTIGDEYHGHTRSWDELTNAMKKALVDAGIFNRRGKLQR